MCASKLPVRSVMHAAHAVAAAEISIVKRVAEPLSRHSIRQFIEFGTTMTEEKLVTSGKYVHKALKARISRQLYALQTLPYILMTNSNIVEVHRMLNEAHKQLHTFEEIRTIEEDAKFTELLRRLFQDTMGIVDLMAKGLSEATTEVSIDLLNVDAFMDRMIRSRIDRRILVEQHIALHNPPRNDWVGIVNLQTSPLECFQMAERLASELCTETYGVTLPPVNYKGKTECVFPYIPYHMEYMCTELLKNAMRAVAERNVMNPHSESIAPIDVLIAEGEEDVSMRISDQGGGIKKEILEKIFKYGFSTMVEGGTHHHHHRHSKRHGHHHHHQHGHQQQFDFQPQTNRMIAGKGFGLPMARLYAEYYGGTLELITIDGHGTDVYVKIDKTATNVGGAN